MLRRLFTEHPATVDETYGEHLVVAWSFSWRLVAAGLACLVHAVLPFLFVKTGSSMVTRLHDRMVTNRHNQTVRKAANASAVGAD
ncbi:MAG: DUF6356 family protein [Alphaproteobacteria bacterium]|jgi:hypothetical protein|nr:DUF6356 family protein [Alphaproteobacteria bacterium]